MELKIPNARLGLTTARQVEGGIEHSCEVLYLGGRAFVKNPKKLAPGEYGEVVLSVDIKNEADQWMTKDRQRSGAMMVSTIVFGDVVAATPAKK